MPIWIQYVIVFLYAAACALNLIGCTPPEKHRLRKISKCFLMPLLALIYLLSARAFSPLVFIAVLCGFAGDVLLLCPEKKRLFAAGLAAFGVGHILYICHIMRLLVTPPAWWICALAVLPYLAIAAYVMRNLRPQLSKGFFFPCLAYIMLLGLMSYSALLLLIDNASVQTGMVFAGSLLFIISDTVLAFDAFHVRRFRYRHLLVMATYILAQTLIVNGLLHI